MLGLASQLGVVEEVGKKAGTSLIEFGVVGALLAISLALNIALVVKLMKVQDKRVEDKEGDSARLERLASNTTEALVKVTAAVENLERSDRDQSAALMGLKSSMDTVIMQAVSKRRSG